MDLIGFELRPFIHLAFAWIPRYFRKEHRCFFSTPINSEFYEWWSNQPEISEDDSREINDTINTYFNYSEEKSPNQNVTSKNSLSEANCAIEENSLNGENWELSLLNPIEGNQDKVSDEILESDQIQEVLEESKLTSLHVRSKKVDFSKVFFHIKMFIVEEAYKLKYLKDRYGRQPDSDKIVEYPKKPGRKWHQISWDKSILRDNILQFLNNLIESDQRKDAGLTSAGALIKNIPDELLKNMFKISAYKKKFETTIDSYLVSYTEGFANVFDIPQSQLSVEEFLWFISIRFPKQNVIKIIKGMQSPLSLSQELISKIKRFIDWRNKHSIKMLKSQYVSNPVFKLLVIKTKEMYFPNISASVKDKYSKLFAIFD